MTQQDEMREARYETSSRGFGLLLLIGGALGLAAAFQLTVDKMALAENGSKALSCDVNAFVSCSGVMQSPQAEAFGFANSLLGIIGFALVVALGAILLLAVVLPGSVWVALQVGTLFGIGFVTWLQFQSIFQIGKLCPLCIVVWAVTIPIFVYVTTRNARTYFPENAAARFLGNWTLLIVLLWYVTLAAVIWFQFGSTLWA